MNYYHTNANKVREFMESFGQEVKKEPQWPDEDTLNLRLDLIEEEYNQLDLFDDDHNYDVTQRNR
jgi:predicted HAD superfamily Cof-like phosphohydrolase